MTKETTTATEQLEDLIDKHDIPRQECVADDIVKLIFSLVHSVFSHAKDLPAKVVEIRAKYKDDPAILADLNKAADLTLDLIEDAIKEHRAEVAHA